MSKARFKYIYGPVYSWRLDSSLGIDPISRKGKVCTFDCVYCQIGPTDIFTRKRKVFIPTKKIIEEIKSLPPLKIDYITFSGRGEPTLAENLGEIIGQIKKIRKEKIAVITNSSLIDRRDVRDDLCLADFVMFKIDACSAGLFNRINKPIRGIAPGRILEGIKEFKAIYKGRLAVQIMFVENNRAHVKEIMQIVREIYPDEVQINTPLRPSRVRPLSKKEIDNIKTYFDGMKVISVYDVKRKKDEPICRQDTAARRGRDDQGKRHKDS